MIGRPKTKYFNQFEINGNVVTLFLITQKYGVQKTYIDLEDFERIKALNIYWNAGYDTHSHSFYVKATDRYRGPNGKKVPRIRILHREIMQAEPGQIVDHIDHDTLNNCKSNLRLVTQSENSRNRKGPGCRNKSGYRNVALVKGRWLVQIVKNGKLHRVGLFDDVHEAGRVAAAKRKELYGEFAGN